MTEALNQLKPFLAESYENFPKSRTLSLVILRTTQSETVFRTEGSGEPLTREMVHAGFQDQQVTQRLVMTKRKQIAPERRRGREFLRLAELLNKNNKTCTLNSNAPCEQCVDCFLYGFAVGGGGAQKSRVWTEDAFSALPAVENWGTRTLNAIFETGTMRDENGKISTSLNTSEYIKPGVHFLGVMTLKDVTADELRYVMGCVLQTTRYGAVSSRIGRMDNQILAVYAGTSEVPSSLELIQSLHDQLQADQIAIEHPLNTESLLLATQKVLAGWGTRRGVAVALSAEELKSLIEDVDQHWSEAQRSDFLKRLDDSYAPWRKAPAAKKGKKAQEDA